MLDEKEAAEEVEVEDLFSCFAVSSARPYCTKTRQGQARQGGEDPATDPGWSKHVPSQGDVRTGRIRSFLLLGAHRHGKANCFLAPWTQNTKALSLAGRKRDHERAQDHDAQEGALLSLEAGLKRGSADQHCPEIVDGSVEVVSQPDGRAELPSARSQEEEKTNGQRGEGMKNEERAYRTKVRRTGG